MPEIPRTRETRIQLRREWGRVRAVEPAEPDVLIDALCAPWGRTSEASVSAVDVLLCDALENEDRPRPDDGIVSLVSGRHGFRAGDLAHWTMGWPQGRGMFAKMLGAGERAIGTRLSRDETDAASRVAAFRAMRSALGAIPWTTLADMEVVSLAMGHYGPARQPAAWGITTPWLHAAAVRVAATTFRREELAAAASRVAALYEASMREVAADSVAAIGELGRRAAAKGTPSGDPFARPIRFYLPILGGTLV